MTGLQQGMTCSIVGKIRKCNVREKLVRAIQPLYDKVGDVDCISGNADDCFRTAVGIRQGLLAPTLFNIFLEKMSEALEAHKGIVSIERKITNLRFAADIDGLAGRKQRT